MKRRLSLIASVCLIVLSGCAVTKPPVYEGALFVPAEDSVPGVPPDVQYADYWIRTSADPDAIILTPEEIQAFNRDNPMNGEGIIDVLGLPAEIDGTEIRSHLAGNARYLLDATFYVTGDIPLEQAERQRIVALMDTTGIRDVIPLKLGVMLRRVQGKNWPTAVPFVRRPNTFEFDRTVGSAIDMGNPVALLHVSKDGRWAFIQNAMYTCWVPSEAIAFGDIETIRELRDTTNPVVAIGHRVTVYSTPDSGTAVGSIQMGSYLPLRTAGTDFCEVLVPGRGENNELVVKRGYVRRSSDVSMGFLPYTLRNIYQQCFVPFGRRYGWAGMFEERDCSRLVMDVFKSFGFVLPRTSGTLLKASKAVLDLEGYDRATRMDLLKKSPGGITLVGWPGHIMIYLGHIGETPYVIQATYGWTEPVGEGIDVRHRLARVLVGDLLMDEGSASGARIDRLTHLTILGNYTFTGSQ